MWILTREINEYDQDGEYFVTAWEKQPTHSELYCVLSKIGYGADPHVVTNHVSKGGGRISTEYEWYYLFQIVDGERIEK